MTEQPPTALRSLAAQTRMNLVDLGAQWAQLGIDVASSTLELWARSLAQTADSLEELRNSLPRASATSKRRG